MTLVRHLAGQFSAHPENLAIESLHYLIQSAPDARAAVLHLFGTACGLTFPSELHFETQVTGDDLDRPDLVGRDVEGVSRVVIETKFWAGLTEHQPLSYLRRLPETGIGALIFIAPEARFATLWGELTSRCREGGVLLDPTATLPAARSAALGPSQRLVLTSWRAVLAAIAEAAALGHNLMLGNDTAQLQGLCDQMDSEAFLPLRSEELTAAEIPRRLLQYAKLVTEIGDEAIQLGLCSLRGGLRPGSGSGYTGRYLRLGDVQVFLSFDWNLWAQYGNPLWLRLEADAETSQATISERLARLRQAMPPQAIEYGGKIWVPLSLSTGCEKTRVIAAVVAQLQGIARLFPAKPTVAAVS